MPRYSLERLGDTRFESLVQGLLEAKRRGFGELIQFGPGQDGGREATWEQPIDHPEFRKLTGLSDDAPRKWVFQVKYHDIGVRGWKGAAEALIGELKSELQKITRKHKLGCNCYVIITNVVLSGVRYRGTRDKLNDIIARHRKQIPSIEVWDGTDVSRMLDANESVRTAYLDDVVPGDFLKAVLRQLDLSQDRKKSALAAYLRHVVESTSGARAQEAGDEGELPLSHVYVDLALKIERSAVDESEREALELWFTERDRGHKESQPDSRLRPGEITASAAMLFEPHQVSMILAGPGYGKSTITQFLALYHAVKLTGDHLGLPLARRLRLPDTIDCNSLDSFIKLRIPFRVELRKFAKWQSSLSAEKRPGQLAEYISSQLINNNVSGTFGKEDIFEIVHNNPVLLILDGLDEVPGKDDRDAVVKAIDAFLVRCKGEKADLQLILSSRPQGYGNEFEKYNPIRWSVIDLDRKLFDDYVAAWLNLRVKDAQDRADAMNRIERGMKADSVVRLASTLLQATVMLTIVKRKSEIPHERHKLYSKYIEVIFEREREKWPLVAEYEEELKRLHEHAGYELHKAVEAGRDKTIRPAAFRQMVLLIWEQYRGDQPLSGNLTSTINEIITAATNRLVFLSGQGADQSDIDFVIQSFREYFAAQYLASHSDSDHAKVLDMLVSRGFFWANVLQFFIGLSKPAEQITWMHNFATVGAGVRDTSSLIGLTRARRALIQCLPEFRKPTTTHFAKAVAIALSPDTRWTWHQQSSALRLLGSLRPEESQRAIFELMLPLATDDPGRLLVELEYCAQLIPKDSELYDRFAAETQRCLTIPAVRQIALNAAVEYGIKVSLASVPDSETTLVTELIQASFNAIRHSPPDVRYHHIDITNDQGIQLVCRAPYLLQHYPEAQKQLTKAVPWSCLRIRFDKSDLTEDEPDSAKLPLAPFFIRPPGQTVLPWPRECIQGTGVYADFLYRLGAAALNPTEPELDRQARTAQAELPYPPALVLTCDHCLGPATAIFPNAQAWIEFKQQLAAFHNDHHARNTEFTLLNSQPNAGEGPIWLLLLFHPTAWDLCHQTGLVSSESVRRAQSTRLATLLRQCPTALSLLTRLPIASRGSAESAGLTWKLLATVAEVTQQFGPGAVAPNPQSALRPIRYPDRPPGWDPNTLLQSYSSLLQIHPSWHSLAFRVFLHQDSTSPAMLLDYWDKLASHNTNVMEDFYPYAPIPDRLLTALMGAINAKPSASNLIFLSLCLCQSREPDAQVSHPLSNALTSLLKDDASLSDAALSSVIRASLLAPFTSESLDVYLSERLFARCLRANPFLLDVFCERFDTLLENESIRTAEWSRAFLEKLVAARAVFPPQLSVTAMNLLLQLDARQLPILHDSQWQLTRTDDS